MSDQYLQWTRLTGTPKAVTRPDDVATRDDIERIKNEILYWTAGFVGAGVAVVLLFVL